MSKFLSLFLLGLRKDLLNAMSYKVQFFGSFVIIFFNLTIYYYFLEFIKVSNITNLDIEYFKFIFVGLLIIDFSTIIVRSLSGPITTYKNQGIFEELMSLPVPEIQIILNSLPYALFNGFLRVSCFILFYFLLYEPSLLPLQDILLLCISILLFIICSCGISLIFTGVTLIFHRGEGLPFFYSAVSTLLGGVFYPVSIISEKLEVFTNILPIKHIIEVIRGITNISTSTEPSLYFNLGFLFILSLLFGFTGWLVWRKSLEITKRQASLYLY